MRLIAGANVAFESVKFPGNYLSVGPDGLVKLVSLHLESVNVQFTIRVIVSNLRILSSILQTC